MGTLPHQVLLRCLKEQRLQEPSVEVEVEVEVEANVKVDVEVEVEVVKAMYLDFQ